MPIMSVRDYENNRWKINAKKKEDRREQGGQNSFRHF